MRTVLRAGEPMIRVRLLGSVRIWRDGHPLPPGPPQQQLLLALLALRAGTAVSRDDLVDAIWERAPASAISTVHKRICMLRATLDPGHRTNPTEVLATVTGGYELRLATEVVDAALFDRLLTQARRASAAGDLPRALGYLSSGLRLWQGTALSGLAGTWAQAQRQHLDETRLAAIEERADILLALGHHAGLPAELTGLADRYPLREGLWYRLIIARYRCGHPASALATYQHIRQVLAEELGTEPGPQLRRLYQQILHHDASLDPPTALASAGTR